MPNTKITVAEVRQVLDEVAQAHPAKIDRRAETGRLVPRLWEHGAPACLSGVILHRLKVRPSILKEINEQRLIDARHPVRKKFEPEAWDLLAYLQRNNDRGLPWSAVAKKAFTPNRYWLREGNRRYAYPGPWCTEENALPPE